MFIRRRRLLWLILVIGSSWVVISTYFVRSSDDSLPHPHTSRSHDKNSVRPGAVSSTGLLSNDFYYDDNDNAELVINMAKEKFASRLTSVVQSFRGIEVFSPVPAAYDMADSEIDLKDTNDQDHIAKPAENPQMITAPKSSVLHRRKEPTPKVQESSALKFARRTEKMFTSQLDYVKLLPGNDTVFLFL